MITIKNLSVGYKKNLNVLESLSLILESKKIHGIIGLNGSGKTTFFNTLFGLIKANSGVIKLNNEILTKKNISYLMMENYFYPEITGSEYLNLFNNKKFNNDSWNELFHLPLNQLISTYSTGMKKKISILGFLKNQKEVLILDEPFNGLDLECGRILRSILLNLKDKGKLILISSHIMESLTNLCDFIHYLEDKKIKDSKSKDHFDQLEKNLFNTIEDKFDNIINSLI